MECGAYARTCLVQAIDVQIGVGCAWVIISAALRGNAMDRGECRCGGDAGFCWGTREKEFICDDQK